MGCHTAKGVSTFQTVVFSKVGSTKAKLKDRTMYTSMPMAPSIADPLNILNRMDLESSFSIMAFNIQVIGLMESLMEKIVSKFIRMGVNMWGVLLMALKKVKVNIFGLMVKYILVTLKMDICMEEELSRKENNPTTKVNSSLAKNKEGAFLNFLSACMKVLLLMVWWTVKGLFYGMTEKNIQVIFLMEKCMEWEH